MAKKMEEKLNYNIDTEALNEEEMPIPVEIKREEAETPRETVRKSYSPVNVLRNERIAIRYIPRESSMVTNPKHVLYGGMSEGSFREFVVPRQRSGAYVNVLTDDEKNCLEEVMGLEHNALSTLKKKDNFWDDSNELGISRVRLRKQDNYLDLSDAGDYIRYKILLANKDYIAPSLKALQDNKKATYQFVIIAEGEENKRARDNMSTTMMCYKEFGKVEDNKDILSVIIETIDGRPVDPNTQLEFLQTKINTLIQADSKLFLRVITDPYLNTKVLIKAAVAAGIIANRGQYFYMREDNLPLCENGEDPTLSIAAAYLSSSKHQDVLFAIQAKLKN